MPLVFQLPVDYSDFIDSFSFDKKVPTSFISQEDLNALIEEGVFDPDSEEDEEEKEKLHEDEEEAHRVYDLADELR